MKLIIELTFLIPLLTFCLGRVTDNGSSQDVKETFHRASGDVLKMLNLIDNRIVFTAKDGSKRTLRPSLSVRDGPAKIVEMDVGETKYLECEAGGSPPPTIHWLKDGKKVAQSYYESIHSGENEDEILPSHLGLGFTKSRLFIDCASTQDAGKYTCVAENEYLRDSKSGQVFVIDSLDGDRDTICLAKKTFGSPARVHMWTHTRLEMMGTDVQLFCRPDGDPQPEVIWTGVEGEAIENSRKYKIMENGDLIIRNLVWADMGGYTCRVKNSEGSDEILIFLYPTLPNKKKNTRV